MSKSSCSAGEEDSALPTRRVVCADLDIDLVGKNLTELRKQAKKIVDERGDRRVDYHFQSFESGKLQSQFVISPTQGLRDFQRRPYRRAV